VREHQQPMTQTISVSEARQQFSQLLNQVFRRETRVLIEKSGIPVAAIISAEDAARLDEYEREREEDFAIVEEIQEAFADVPADELEQEVSRAVRRARARLATQRGRALQSSVR
jgi:prevent-host-death family protein